VVLKNLAEYSKQKVATGGGPIGCTWYIKKQEEESNLKIVTGEGPIFVTCY